MLLQFGIDSIVDNIVALVGAEFDFSKISNEDDLRRNFIELINVLQPRKMARRTDGIGFVLDVKDAGVLGSYF